MTTAVQRRPAKPPAEFNPLASLPAPLLEPASRFLLFFADLLKDQVGFAARLSYWTDEEGMTPDDAVAAFKSLMKPAGSAGLDYGGRLLAALGVAVDKAIGDRKAAERAARLNNTVGDLRPDKAAAETLADALAKRGLRPAKPRGPEHLPGNGRQGRK